MGSAPSTTSPRSGFCLLGAFGVSATSVAAKNHQFFMHVLLPALPYTKRSCGIDICYTEVLRTECWPRQGSHFPKQKIAGRNSNCLFQPNPNILLSPCWSSTLRGCTGMQVSRYPLAAGSSDRTKRCLKENIHRRRDQAGKK